MKSENNQNEHALSIEILEKEGKLRDVSREGALISKGGFLPVVDLDIVAGVMSESCRLGMLELANSLIKKGKRDTIISNDRRDFFEGDGGEREQSNSIVDGFLGIVDPEDIDKTHTDLVEKLIDTIVGIYLSNVIPEDQQHNLDDKNPYKLIDVWCVSMASGDYHIVHDHKCDLAGSIYVDIDSNIINQSNAPQGCIEWIFPGAPLFREHGHLKTARFLPTSGAVAAWSGTTLHHVYPARGTGNRIMFSFNVDFNRVL